MFSNIKKGQLAKKAFIFQKKKKICEKFLRILWDEGFILGYNNDKKNPNKLKIFLKYKNEDPVISSIQLITKPEKRVYFTIKQIWEFDSNKTFIIFSTNKGLKTIQDCKKLKIGGEPFIIIY